MNHAAFILCTLAALLLWACERAPLSGPPDMQLGRHECKACGMLVSEDRCSSALLVESHGRREYFFYDDLGCMLDQVREGIDDATVIEVFARDYGARSWLSAKDATFLFADAARLQTPMGSGIVAFLAAADAQSANARYGGRTMTYPDLVEARRAWTEERYGRPGPKPARSPDPASPAGEASTDGPTAGKGPP